MQNGQLWNEAEPDLAPCDLDATLDFLRQTPWDFLFLQEVEEGHDGGRQVQPPPNFQRLREGLSGAESCFAYPPVNPDELPFGLGLAIFSRFPLSGVRRRVLPAAELRFDFGGRERRPSERIVLEARAEVGGRSLRLLNAHLQAYFMLGTSSNEHRAQRDLVEAILREEPGPTILGGDFNCAPDEDWVGQLAGIGFRSAQTEEVTWRRRPYVVDHLFYSGDWELEACEVLPTPASDHHGVRAVLTLPDSSNP